MHYLGKAFALLAISNSRSLSMLRFQSLPLFTSFFTGQCCSAAWPSSCGMHTLGRRLLYWQSRIQGQCCSAAWPSSCGMHTLGRRLLYWQSRIQGPSPCCGFSLCPFSLLSSQVSASRRPGQVAASICSVL
ncbi:hypothetical protein BX666DRAFT_973587 [Dichotomocladium elegans]|nr:hypothetical protein BX666DRAFT_973587 [Dichotomocladium elegans]